MGRTISTRRLDPELYRVLCLLPRERRRLARAGAAPHRVHARRVPLARRLYQGFSRAHVESLILQAVPGLSPRNIWITTPEPGTVRIEIAGCPMDLAFARAAVEPMVPCWARVVFVRRGEQEDEQ